MTDDVMARVGGRGCGGAVAFLWGVGRLVRADRFRWGWIVSGFVEGLLCGGGDCSGVRRSWVGWGRVRLVPAPPIWRSRLPGSARPLPGGRCATAGPALAGGLGGGARVGGSQGSGGGPGSPLGRVVGCRRRGRRLDPWPQWCTSPPEVRAAALLARPGRACPGALAALSVPRARAGGPADDAADSAGPGGERDAASTPTGSARGRRSTTHPRFGPVTAETRRSRPVGPGPPRRARWRGAFCRGRPPTAPAPACAPPAAPGHRGTPVLGVEEAPGLRRPECRVGAAPPSGRGSSDVREPSTHRGPGSSLRTRILPPPRQRRTPTSSRAGGTGRHEPSGRAGPAA